MRFRAGIYEAISDSPPLIEGGQEIWYDEDHSFMFVRLKSGKRSIVRRHGEVGETYAILQGRACFNCDGYEIYLDSGQLITFCKGQVHFVRNENQEDVIMLVSGKHASNDYWGREKPAHH